MALSLARSMISATDFGYDDNFFDCGGNSLRASTLLMGVEKRFNRQLTLERVFQSSDVQQSSSPDANRFGVAGKRSRTEFLAAASCHWPGDIVLCRGLERRAGFRGPPDARRENRDGSLPAAFLRASRRLRVRLYWPRRSVRSSRFMRFVRFSTSATTTTRTWSKPWRCAM